jgi:hypothetical protein
MHELLKCGKLEPIADVAQDYTGMRPSRCTNRRWVTKGTNGVKLAAVLYLDRWLTTRAAFEDFLARRTAAALKPRESMPPAVDEQLRDSVPAANDEKRRASVPAANDDQFCESV